MKWGEEAKFEKFCSLNEDKYKTLVIYLSVRWLSLETCADRICDLLQSLSAYFDKQASSGRVSEAAWKRNQGLHDRISSTDVCLYLYFMKCQLPQLADIKRELQKKNQTYYTTDRASPS